MGIVWLARDEQLERNVALKFLSEQIIHDAALLSDLKRETKRSLELTHPNIVRIHDFVHDGRAACISMEFVDGETLSCLRVKQPNRVFDTPHLETLIAQSCEAMHYAHTQARVVHCDLKPANLMVNGKGALKITDFGIARSLSDSASKLTVARGKSGTLVYMSPQQLNGDPPSVLDDVYSMGATLYELLSGKPPFHRGQIDRQIFEKTPASIAERRREFAIKSAYIVPIQWEETIAACLEKEPGDRPQTAFEIQRSLGLGPSLAAEQRNTQIGRGAVQVGGTPSQRHPARGTPAVVPQRDLRRLTLAPPHKPAMPTQSNAGEPLSSSILSGAASSPVNAKAGNSVRFSPFSLCAGIICLLIIGVGWYYLTSPVPVTRVRESQQPHTPSPTTSAPHTEKNLILPSAISSSAIKANPSSASQPSPVTMPTPSATVSRSLSSSWVENTTPVPKDEATQLRDALLTAERDIISVHEEIPLQEKVARMASRARVKYEKALIAFYEGYPSTSRSLALEAEALEPNQPLILNLRGVILLSEGSFEEAETLLARAVSLDERFREAAYNLACATFKKKEYPRARKRFEQLSNSISLKPDDRFGQLLHYRVYLSLILEGALDAARQAMQGMQLDADTPASYYAHAAWEFRRGNAVVAKNWLDQARAKYAVDLNLVFAAPLYDIGWLGATTPQVSATPSPATSASPIATLAPKTLSITETKLFRNPDSKAALHLTLNIGVTPKPKTPAPQFVEIHVSFFDNTPDSKVIPTEATTSYRWVDSKPNWSQSTTRYFLATYIRPLIVAPSQEGRKFGGYVVRLYADGQLQDWRSEPQRLWALFPVDSQPITAAKPVPETQPPATPVSSEVSDGDSVIKIKGLEDKWAEAIRLHDSDTIEGLLSIDHVAISPRGRLLHKREAVDRIRKDTDTYEFVGVGNIEIHVENLRAAVATGLLREHGKDKGGTPFERIFYFKDMWIKNGDGWFCKESRTSTSPIQ